MELRRATSLSTTDAWASRRRSVVQRWPAVPTADYLDREPTPVKQVISTGTAPTVLLVAADELAAAWLPFARWKTRQGLPTKIVTVRQIARGYEASSIEEKIRLCVREHIDQQGTRHVIRGGDTAPGGGRVPGGPRTYHREEPMGIPTDLVYISPTNWDADGDGRHGEWKDDREAITYPDGSIGLGRIPARTVEDVWNITLAKHGDAAPTQNEVIQLPSQLYNANLLSADAAPETEQLLRRGRERLKKKATQQAIGIMYFRIRIFNPDRMLAWIEPVLRPILNRVGFIAWCALIITALVMLLPNWQALTEGFGSTIAPSNWPWLIVVFIVTKAIHETGHGVICKRFGGHIPEFGFMLLVLFPAPYVDASSAWAFDNKWRRIAVGAGGMIFELAVAAVAAFVWLSTQDGSLTKQIAYNVIFTASVSTILFNANPLMRFDGYYILSDLLEVPNLMQRSTNLLKYYFKRYAFGMENEVPPTTLPGEYAILLTYGILALAYRVFLFISITLYVMGKMFALGLVLAIWTAAMWFFLPVGKLTHWLASSPQLVEKRSRAILWWRRSP